MNHPPHPPNLGGGTHQIRGVLGAYIYIRIIERVGQDG